MMSDPIKFDSVHPIGDTDVNALPVKDLGPAIAFYKHVLGFSLISKDSKKAVLGRDTAEIGLEINALDPEQISCYFSVSPLDALWQEYTDKGIEPSPIRVDSYNGKSYRVFFAKEPYGVCFCFGEEII